MRNISNTDKHLKKILSLGRVFWDSQVLLVSVELNIFDQLLDWTDSSDVAKSIKADNKATLMLLDALVSLGFLQKKNDKYRLKQAYANFLNSKSDKNVLSILKHYYYMWEDWGRLIESIKTGKAIEKQLDLETKKKYTKVFITGMDDLTKFYKDRIIKEIGLNNVKKILDIGSGPATYVREILKKNKNIKATILDLPIASQIGKEFIKKDNLLKRVDFIEGDIKEVDIGKGYDCVFIFQVLHALDIDTRKIALKKTYDSLKNNGKIYIHEFYLNNSKTGPKDNVVFRLNMLIHAVGGDNLTINELKNLLETTGFKIGKIVKFKNPSTVLVEGKKSI